MTVKKMISLADRVMRVGLVSDYLEEQWPSMDLVADMLIRELGDSAAFRVSQIRPRFVPRFSRIGRAKYLFNVDRLLNRFVDYPRYLRKCKSEFDLFHIVDHTYAHLVSVVGGERCVVTCHDLDAFRPLIEPERNGFLMRKAAGRILDGFREAAAVPCDSAATRDDVSRHRLAPAERLSVNPNGVAEVFTFRPDACADAAGRRLLGAPERDRLEIVNVGSTSARKRIDVLLRVFAALRREMPRARLIRVGGALTPPQRQLMRELNLPADSVVETPFVSREVLAAIYRHAAIAVLPSEYEGFGFPALEAQACGTPAVLSDIPVFREIGGPAAAFSPVADIAGWAESILMLEQERRNDPRRWCERVEAGVRWAGRFTWKDHAERAAQLYRRVAAA
jgi:glycosyltransferase involved in cell wall biosynthesis